MRQKREKDSRKRAAIHCEGGKEAKRVSIGTRARRKERKEEATKFTTVWSSLHEGESPNEAEISQGKECSYKRSYRKF